MMLIFIFSAMAVIAGIGVQFDDMPSNDGAGLLLAGIGAPIALLTGATMWWPQ